MLLMLLTLHSPHTCSIPSLKDFSQSFVSRDYYGEVGDPAAAAARGHDELPWRANIGTPKVRAGALQLVAVA